MLPPFNFFDPALDFMAAARQLATNYVGAIRQAGVPRVVQLSSVGADLAAGSGALLFHHLAEAIFGELPAAIALTHLRPVGFYNNLYQHLASIKSRGVMAGNYGGADQAVWVSPRDIAAAVAEELTTPAAGRRVRYVASDELTCHEVARILGEAVGQPQLQWLLVSDQEMLSGLAQFNVPEPAAKALVEMNAGIHRGLVDADYYRHRPAVLGTVKMADFAQEFAAAYHQS
ncbi:hypothetical protein A0257_11070 [Hymenobacter psoromatis]|nr:hypothetical protein A0257_11070 [Hymenobacter psoromatis]